MSQKHGNKREESQQKVKGILCASGKKPPKKEKLQTLQRAKNCWSRFLKE